MFQSDVLIVEWEIHVHQGLVADGSFARKAGSFERKAMSRYLLGGSVKLSKGTST